MAFTNISKWVTSGEEYVFWGALNSGYPYGTTGSISNGSDAGMGRLTGVVGVNLAVPDAPTQVVVGDNSVIASFRGRVVDNITGTFDTNITDLAFEAFTDGRAVYADGVMDTVMLSTTCQDFQPVCLVVNSRAKSQESATLSEKGWDVLEVFNVELPSRIDWLCRYRKRD